MELQPDTCLNKKIFTIFYSRSRQLFIMSIKVFQDNTFPRHVSDLMNLMHMVVFTGSDGEESWTSYLTLKQKEYVALALAQYYQCEHCVSHHAKEICKLDKSCTNTLSRNIDSIVLFLRIDTRTISHSEKEHWIEAWQRFAKNISKATGDRATPYLIGLAIGMARNDEFLVRFCGNEVISILKSEKVEPRNAIGELESVVIFMKAAASKNRIVSKIERLFQS